MGSTSNRRTFLKSSALIAAPVVALAAPAAAFAADDGAARLARIEDERAIEAAQRAFFKQPAAKKLRGKTRKGETVRRIDPDHEADAGGIEFSDDGRRAIAKQNCTVQLASHYDGDTTLEQMARLQGTAKTVRSKRCVILAHYHKQGGEWSLQLAEFA
jgi:hypothetical protein